MYKAFYSLAATPFAKEVKPEHAYASASFQETAAVLAYLKQTRGMGMIVGEPGAGKTYSLRVFSDSLNKALTENSSGKRKGLTGISKRGRSRLRVILFRAALPLVAKNSEFQAPHRYFTTRSQNPLKKKQSLIALCGKLLRVLFTLGTKQKEYNANDVLGPVRQAQLQRDAA